MNKVILLGRLTKEPVIRVSQTTETKIASFTLAVNRKYVKEGKERKADFINIVAYSKLAEFVEKYIAKGQQICISGRIQTRVYDDEEGQKHYVTEVIAEEIDFADSYKKNEPDESILNRKPKQSNAEIGISDNDEDLPF